MIDSLLEQEGHALNYFPIMNYTHGNLDDVRSMMTHPHTLFGLSDAGAHCGVLCDASFPTTTLTHWGRDRTRGERLAFALADSRPYTENRTAGRYGGSRRAGAGLPR